MTAQLGIAVFGATGSVGRQVLDVIAAFPDRYRAIGLAANTSAGSMAELVMRHRPRWVVMNDVDASKELAGLLKGKLPTEIESGTQSLDALACEPDVDIVVASIVGRGGLRSVVSAVRAGKKVALANKEALVMAGELVMRESKRTGASIVPVDSEHAAVQQLISSAGMERIEKVYITASGGPFLDTSKEDLETVTVQQALTHPNWEMGAKISIDSATMMNKGFEVMEARWLFDLPMDRIGVVVHPESVVHALVELTDGSVLAQMAQPDMRVPISQALAYPSLLDLPKKLEKFSCLDITKTDRLTFRQLDYSIFPAVKLCRLAMQIGGDLPAALSVADEVVVDAFLHGKIRFSDITNVLSEIIEKWKVHPVDGLDEILAAGEAGARLSREIISSGRYCL